MGRYYCNGKKGYCDRFVGNVQNAETIDCKDCEYADGTGGEYKDIVTNYDRIKSMSVEEMAEWLVEVKEDLQRVVFEHIQEKIKDYVIQVDYDRIKEWEEKQKMISNNGYCRR